MKKYFDISPLISSSLAVFPGDTPFTQSVALSFEKSHHLFLSSIQTTLHIGAHADSPSHYHAEGETMEALSLDPYLGKVCLVTAKTSRGERVLPADIVLPEFCPPRVLVRTNSFPNPEVWNSDFCSLSPELIEMLHAKGVFLVGIDTPSVDPETSKKLESHQALFRTQMRVLEGLVFDGVPDGEYLLIALPLKLKGCDASPVRAILLTGNYF